MSSASAQTSPMSGWLIGLFLGAIGAIGLLAFGIVGMVWTLACLALIAWKGPRLAAGSGLVTGAGAVWLILFANVMGRCAAENATPGMSCDAGGIFAWVAVAAGIVLVGAVGTVVAARRLRVR